MGYKSLEETAVFVVQRKRNQSTSICREKDRVEYSSSQNNFTIKILIDADFLSIFSSFALTCHAMWSPADGVSRGGLWSDEVFDL